MLNLDFFKKKLVFGGLIKKDNREAVLIRCNQIRSGFKIHTCFHYQDSLAIISQAQKELNIKPKLITKIYFNYNILSKRFNNVYNQLESIVEKLKFIPNEWDIQICCNPNYKFFDERFNFFKKKAIDNFKIKNFLIETFPLWEKNTKKIIINKKVDGSIFHQNILMRGCVDEVFKKKNYCTISPLLGGLNILDKYKSYSILNEEKIIKFYNKFTNYFKLNDYIDLNILLLIEEMKKENFMYTVTRVSSLANYNNLLNRINNIINKNISISNEEIKFIFNEHNKIGKIYIMDPYGVAYKNLFQRITKQKKTSLKYFFEKIFFGLKLNKKFPYIQKPKIWM